MRYLDGFLLVKSQLLRQVAVRRHAAVFVLTSNLTTAQGQLADEVVDRLGSLLRLLIQHSFRFVLKSDLWLNHFLLRFVVGNNFSPGDWSSCLSFYLLNLLLNLFLEFFLLVHVSVSRHHAHVAISLSLVAHLASSLSPLQRARLSWQQLFAIVHFVLLFECELLFIVPCHQNLFLLWTLHLPELLAPLLKELGEPVLVD